MSDILFFENYSSTNWRPRTLTLSHVILGKLVKCSLCFSLKVKLKVLSRVQLFATLWTIAHQASLSMGFPRQEYWTGLPFPSPGDLPNPGIEHVSSALVGGFFTTEPPGKPEAPFLGIWNWP